MDYIFTKEELKILEKECYPHDRHFLPKKKRGDMHYELYHHGILGMHWGIRRFQNEDGSLTAAGKKRYGNTDPNYWKTKEGKKEIRKFGSLKKAVKWKEIRDASEFAHKKNNESLRKILSEHGNEKGLKYFKAVNEGKFDIEFVEKTDNYDWSEKKALSEYKKYLLNPDEYFSLLRKTNK